MLNLKISALQTENQSHVTKIEQLHETASAKNEELEQLQNQTTESHSKLVNQLCQGESQLLQLKSEKESLSSKLSQTEGDLKLKFNEVEILTVALTQKTNEFEIFSQSKGEELEQNYLQMQGSLRASLEQELASGKQVYETSLNEMSVKVTSLEKENVTIAETLKKSLQQKTKELEQLKIKAEGDMNQLKVAEAAALLVQKQRYKTRIQEVRLHSTLLH